MNTPKDETENDFLFQLQVYKEEGAKGLLQVLDIDPFYLGENEISNLNKFIDNHALHNRQQAEEQGRKKERERKLKLYSIVGASDWLREYGVDDFDTYSAGEVCELLQSFIDDCVLLEEKNDKNTL